MILGSTIKAISRIAPGYRLVSGAIARNSVSVCVCSRCRNCMSSGGNGQHGRFVCKPLRDRLDEGEQGHATVAWNGSCDRAEFAKVDMSEFKLT